MTATNDTIVAIATPPGRGGIGVLRISGPRVRVIAAGLIGGLPPVRVVTLRDFVDAEGGVLDTGLTLFFAAPASFTGEDVLELHGHGGRVVLDLLLQRALELGARLAQPGEFSERAYLNDKLDLVQAEAIADLIDSGTAQAARAALRSLRGEFSARIEALMEALIALRMYVEAAIDFPEEEVDFLTEGDVASRLAGIQRSFEMLAAAARQGSLMREGLKVVIAGRPNAGKSSLLNYLAGHEAAIVTDIPGTTRDVLHEHVSLDGMPVHLTDTAGLRESTDAVEQEGVRRAWREIREADHLLLVVDVTVGLQQADRKILAELPPNLPVTLVFNKTDLIGQAPKATETEGRNGIHISATTGAGMDLLRQALKRAAGFEQVGEDTFMARRRHLDALQRVREHLLAAAKQVETRAGELLAEELRQAQLALSEITGEFSSDDLLGRIFSNFCIGK